MELRPDPWGDPVSRRYLHPLAYVFAASFVLALNPHPGPWRTAAVAVFVVSGLAITALVIRRGGTQ